MYTTSPSAAWSGGYAAAAELTVRITLSGVVASIRKGEGVHDFRLVLCTLRHAVLLVKGPVGVKITRSYGIDLSETARPVVDPPLARSGITTIGVKVFEKGIVGILGRLMLGFATSPNLRKVLLACSHLLLSADLFCRKQHKHSLMNTARQPQRWLNGESGIKRRDRDET